MTEAAKLVGAGCATIALAGAGAGIGRANVCPSSNPSAVQVSVGGFHTLFGITIPNGRAACESWMMYKEFRISQRT